TSSSTLGSRPDGRRPRPAPSRARRSWVTPAASMDLVEVVAAGVERRARRVDGGALLPDVGLGVGLETGIVVSLGAVPVDPIELGEVGPRGRQVELGLA